MGLGQSAMESVVGQRVGLLGIPTAQEVVRTDLEHICDNLKDEFAHLSGQKLLITGGAGFLGYYVVQSVLEWNRDKAETRHIQVTVVDNSIRGVPGWLREAKSRGDLALVGHDVCTPLPKHLRDFQYVIHAASIASPTYYRLHPIECMDANVNGLRSLLEYMRCQKETSKPVRGFLFFSSSEVYGDPPPEQIPTAETYRGNVSCTGPRACYDEAKRYGETLCVNFARQYELPIKIVRPFNNYGPGLKITDKRVVPDFARDILAGRDIIMFSDGRAMRTFCYVADAVVGYYKALVRGWKGKAYNIGVEEPEISIEELGKRMITLGRTLFGYSGQVVHQTSSEKDYLVDNPARRCPSIAKARTDLGYDPAVSLEEGLKRSMVWYSENQDGVEA